MRYFISPYSNLASILFVLILPVAAIAGENIVESTPATIPAIIYSDVDGKQRTLDTSKHKLTALHFWATWCVPCVKELPLVNETQKKYVKNGLQIIALSLDGKNIDKVKKFYADNNINNLELLLDSELSAFQQLKIHGLPTTIFINSAGKEISRAEKPIEWNGKETTDFIESRIGVINKSGANPDFRTFP